MTIREHIKQIQLEIGKGELQPQRMAELLQIISAIKGNIRDEIKEADLEYNVKLLACLE